MPSRPPVPRMLRWLALLALSLLTLLAAAWWLTRPVQPDAFYTPPAGLPPQPGRLVRQEPFNTDVPAGAQAWRILYTTTRADGAPAVASAIVMAAGDLLDGAAGSARPAILWTHGTTGVQPGCAPALIKAPFANVPGLLPLLERGWVYIGTDYTGQGTAGPHPYLIGAGQARSALDALRAAGSMKTLRLANAAVVWGHSQGGHAALWTATVAPSYAPELDLRGVAAVAPASDLVALVDEVQHSVVGRVMTSYLLQAYSAHYDDVRFDDYARGVKGVLARAMASRCLAGGGALAAVGAALLTGGSIFDVPPSSGALRNRLDENTPHAVPVTPVLLGQGLADDLVLPHVQRRFATSLCSRGAALHFTEYPGRDHLSVVAADSPFINDLVAWTAERFEGRPALRSCPG